MRQTAIAAMLCAVIVGKKQTTMERSVKSRMDAFAKHVNVMQEDDWWSPYPPDRECFTWPVSESCDSQWWDWNSYCYWDWTDMCDTVAEKWYWDSGIEFTDPTRPEDRCAVAPHTMDDDCMEQWDTLWRQCTMDDVDVPYMVTEDCEMVEAFSYAWDIWYGEGEDWLLNMKKAFKRIQPRIQAMRKLRAPKLSSKERLQKTMLATVTKQSKAIKPKTMQEDGEAFVPDDECFAWDFEDETTEAMCDEQWGWYWESCDEWWTESCEDVVDRWFSIGDIEFLEPDSPDDECFLDGENWGSDDCNEQWETLWTQCEGETDEAYYWTDDCEVVWLIGEAWDLWYSDASQVLMKQARKLRQPRHNAMKTAYNRKLALRAKKDAFKAKVNALAVRSAKTLQEDWEAPYPGEECFGVWPLSEDCNWQWDDWLWQCDEDWTDECEDSIDEWFSSDLDFQIPDRPSDGCAVDPLYMSDDCWEEWDNLWMQCNGYADEPYWWTDDCEMVDLFGEAWSIWHGWNDEEWAVLKRSVNKKSPKNKALKATSLKKRIAALKEKKAAPAPVHSKKLFRAFKKQPAKVMQDWEMAFDPMPSEVCLAFDTMVQNEEMCDAEWWGWLAHCDENEDDQVCTDAIEAWFAQDTEWLTVTRPDEECWQDEDTAPEHCEAQWEASWMQCMNKEEGQQDPYKWDETCDTIADWIDEQDWSDDDGESDDEEAAVVLKQKTSRTPITKEALAVKKAKAMTLAKQAAAAQNSTDDNFGAGIAAGAGVGAVGVLAAFLALRACQRKQNDSDNFERLLE